MVKAILIDIEGTVAPISFVKDVLFPYSKEKMESFVKENENKPEIKQILEDVKKIEKREMSTEEVINTLKKWIDEDRKITPLKEIQGYIWEEGFKSGNVKAPLYKDAYEKMLYWNKKGIPMYIYSSGSVKAQKLFFSHTEYGNIVDFFNGFFDTKIGNKKEKGSYEKIARAIGLKPEEILFLSDNPDEIKAAAEAGMQVMRVVREKDAEYIPDFPYPQIKSFEEIEV